MYVALDRHYIAKETFDSIYRQADKTAKMISGLITYLRDNEERYKQSKLKELKKPNRLKKPDGPAVQIRESGETK